MSVILIDTIVDDTGYLLDSAGGQMLVTSAGALIEDSSLNCIQVNNSGTHNITVDGLFYAEDDNATIAAELNGGSTNFYINGQVEGDIGIQVEEFSFATTTLNFIDVGAQGSVVGLYDDALLFTGNSSGATDDTVKNAGQITAAMTAIEMAGGGGDSITNSGTIAGVVGVGFGNNLTMESLDNTGTIEGGSASGASAVSSVGSAAGVDIVNTGAITDGASNPIWSPGSNPSLLFFDDKAGTTSTIDNHGTITGSGYVIQSGSDILDISNSGSVHGGLYSLSGVVVHNSGLWEGQAGSAVTVFDLAAGGDVVTNSRAGEIDGGITLAAGGDTITNGGDIDGAVTVTGTSGTNALTNSGTITGNVALSGAHSTLTNSGSITGNVKLGATETMVNHGQIYGDLTAGSTNTLTNTGVVDGDVKLGAHDTFRVGDVTGAVTATTNDLFEFSGNFGNATIGGFVAGSGATNDIIQFATNDFSTFAKVKAASTQQGADVVIRLDASDSITLTGVTLTSLVAANFTFV